MNWNKAEMTTLLFFKLKFCHKCVAHEDVAVVNSVVAGKGLLYKASSR